MGEANVPLKHKSGEEPAVEGLSHLVLELGRVGTQRVRRRVVHGIVGVRLEEEELMWGGGGDDDDGDDGDKLCPVSSC